MRSLLMTHLALLDRNVPSNGHTHIAELPAPEAEAQAEQIETNHITVY
jgi:hypothetical protein